MSHFTFPEDFLRPDDRSPLEGIDESFVFTYDTYADELGEGQRWSRWEDLEALMRGPEPRPDWVVTSSGAIDTELGVLKTGKEADVFLLCAGTKGKRYALPHARIMMHQPSSGMGGSASDIKIQAQQSLHIKKVLLDLIADHTGQSVEQVVADADRDRWFTAEQAVEYGLVDKVVTNAREAADEGRPARTKD